MLTGDAGADKQRNIKVGRPRRGPTLKTGLALSPEAAAALDALAVESHAPKWEVVDRLILAAAGEPLPAPQVVQWLGQEAADFLAGYSDQRKAEMALKRAWAAAKAIAKHDMGS